MRCLLVALCTIAIGCGQGVPTLERLTLGSGRQVEVVAITTTLGPGTERHTWFEYKSDAPSPEALKREIHEVWSHIRTDQEHNDIRVVSVAATAPRRSVVWRSVVPQLVPRERGCISYTRGAGGVWTESPLGCCRMMPCDTRERS
jgi:hypothetical protein